MTMSVADLLPQASIVGLAELIRRRDVSPVALVEGYLGRIDRFDGGLRAYITILADSARAAAQTAESEIMRGHYRGPLHGIPVGLKDQFSTRGDRTTAGSRLRSDSVSTDDATVVRRLKEAGAILLGKHNMAEFALGGTRRHPFGQPRNPWDPSRIPGHSSSGSGVAVAAALCAAAVGEDTGGSARIPAAACGIVALRPSFGLVSRYGVVPVCWSMDTASPMTRTVEDCAVLLQAIAGPDPRDPLSSSRTVPDYVRDLRLGVQGLRVGVITQLRPADHADADYRSAFQDAVTHLSDVGASVRDVTVPLIGLAAPMFVAICDSDAAEVHFDSIRRRAEEYDSATRARLMSASLVSAGIYNKAQRARRLLRAQMLDALSDVDVLISPMAGGPPPVVEDETRAFESKEDVIRRQFGARSFTTPYSLAALPAISVPIGLSSAGMPIAMQIGGKAFDEQTVLRAASAIEVSLGAPPLHAHSAATLPPAAFASGAASEKKGD